VNEWEFLPHKLAAVFGMCKHTASTIAALAADVVTAALLVCVILGIATLPFVPLAFGSTTGFDLDLHLLSLGSTAACPPLVDDSGAFTA